MRPEIADIVQIEVLDRRIGAVGQQRGPVIIGPDLHPALIDADGDRGVDSAIVLAVATRKQAAHAVHHLSPVTTIGESYAPTVVKAAYTMSSGRARGGKRPDRKSVV